ncbi:thiamine biosynthesis protein ThiS [bacterium]|nr:MAG: thiamine biosynthesis protein ThiS [bacterium]
MQVQVNGSMREVGQRSSLVEFIEQMELDPRYLVIEYNGRALGRADFASVMLEDGDRLELVRPVAGG